VPFQFKKLNIPDIILIEPKKMGDPRGFFSEIFKNSDFAQAGISAKFVQMNHSRSEKGVLRGLHFQKKPKPQGKLVRVLRGSIYDVAVDIRKKSPTYGKWVSAVLDDEAMNMLYVPEGFAHGFCVISGSADIEYLCTDEYAPDLECGIRYDDPKLAIPWPAKKPVLSQKDSIYPLFEEIDSNF
jgi:dTDP-4-dehydrorhamnose 3,5-epimerase